MAVKCRVFQPETEIQAQRKLFEECFPETGGTTKVTAEHYFWKFHSNRNSEESPEYAAEADGSLIGYYAAIPYHYLCNNSILRVGMVCDVMTGVKARGKGVFTQLGKYATRDMARLNYDMTTGYPIRKEVIPGHLKAGWVVNFELPLYGRFIKYDKFLSTRGLGFFKHIANFISSSLTTLLGLFLTKKKGGLSVESNTSGNKTTINELGEFYKVWQKEIQIGLIKDEKFLGWRLGAPGSNYHILILRDKDDVVGAVIAREVIKYNVPCLGIIDLAILKGYHKYSHLLVNELTKIGDTIGSELLLIMISKNWFHKYRLFQNAFFRTPYKFYQIIKLLKDSHNSEFIQDDKNWHLNWIDSDDL
jgi:hypothetical protein